MRAGEKLWNMEENTFPSPGITKDYIDGESKDYWTYWLICNWSAAW